MRIITMSDGMRFRWEPMTDLICARCRKPVDIRTLYQSSLECVNFVWPDEEALQMGEYVYLHKRCSNVPGDWLMLDMTSVLGKDKWFFNCDQYIKKQIPVETWDTLRSQWLPHRRPKLSASFKKASLARRFRILQRDNYRCRLCGISVKDGESVKLEIAHITPKSKGGTNDDSNLWTLCFPCNRGKRDQFL